MRLLKNDYVRQGEVLAVLASQDLQAQRNEAQAALEEARLNLQTLQKVTIPQTRARRPKKIRRTRKPTPTTPAQLTSGAKIYTTKAGFR